MPCGGTSAGTADSPSVMCPGFEEMADPEPDEHELGYRLVDDDPYAPVLLATMDATGRWGATIRLRAWERALLNPSRGERILDVGCGLGDAALALGADLGAGGEVVGVDASTEMIAAARSRAGDAVCRVRFEVGDAVELDEPDGAFDAVRAERALQWLDDPRAAVAEMVRVLRPGGLLSLIDTDWSTFDLDVGDDDLASIVRDAMTTERGRPSNVGGRLADLAVDAGLDIVGRTAATHRWIDWDPDESPAPDGCFSMASLATDLVDAGRLPADRHEWFVDTVHAAARQARFAMSLTVFGVVGRRPPSPNEHPTGC